MTPERMRSFSADAASEQCGARATLESERARLTSPCPAWLARVGRALRSESLAAGARGGGPVLAWAVAVTLGDSAPGALDGERVVIEGRRGVG